MSAQYFDLTTNWTAPGTIQHAFDILSDAERVPQWWSDAYLAAEILEKGDENNIGKRVRFLTRGALPYKISWIATTTAIDRPNRLEIDASGDLIGHGIWTLVQKQETVHLRYNWRVEVHKRWMQVMAPVLKPIFIWNHDWAMQKGEEGFRREMAARQAKSSA